MKESLVAAEVNCTSQGTPSLACITECTLIPPFFFPVLGCRPTPLKIALENNVIVVESIILSCFIHSSVPLRLLSDERMSLLADSSVDLICGMPETEPEIIDEQVALDGELYADNGYGYDDSDIQSDLMA